MIERLSRKCVLLALSAAVAASVPRTAGAQARALTTVRLGTAAGDDATPVVYGQKAGIFAKYGLDLEINRMVGPAAAALLGGTYDFGKSAITTLLQAHENGLPLTLVAAASIHNPKVPYGGFLMRKDAHFESGKDFEDQFVGVGALSDIGQVAIEKWIDEHGGDIKRVKFVEVPTNAAPAAVDQGRVVASESTYPAIAAAIDTGRMKIATYYDSIGNDYVMTAWSVTADYSTKHPELVRAFARGWVESAIYTNGHHAETVALMAEFTHISAELIAKMPRATAGTALLPAQIRPMIEASAKYGAIKRSFPAAELIDPNVR